MADEIEIAFTGDTWRAAAAEATKRAGVALCDGASVKAAEWQVLARRYERNSYIADNPRIK